MKRVAPLLTLALAACSGGGTIPPRDTITVAASGPVTSSATVPYALLGGETLFSVTDNDRTRTITIVVDPATVASDCVTVLPNDVVPPDGLVDVFATNKTGCAYPYNTEITFADDTGAKVNDFLAVSYDDNVLRRAQLPQTGGQL